MFLLESKASHKSEMVRKPPRMGSRSPDLEPGQRSGPWPVYASNTGFPYMGVPSLTSCRHSGGPSLFEVREAVFFDTSFWVQTNASLRTTESKFLLPTGYPPHPTYLTWLRVTLSSLREKT